jgi:GAF domain-containing protein
VALAAILIAAIAALTVTRSIATPLVNLAENAAQIAQGNLDLIAEIENQDEIGILASDFNRMTAQLRNFIANLEARVVERTNDLEKKTAELENVSDRMKKRADQLQAVAHVGRAVTSVQNIEELLPYIAKTTSEQLGFYHIGIFMLDREKEFAVLNASNSDGGKRMLSRGHKLKIGEMGIVGYVASTGRARIALDTGTDAVFFSNPDLPDTHSEMALPLREGKEIIGVLDVQSEQPSAFGQEDIELLTILADQISIAIQNARRFEETQAAIRESEAAIQQYIRREWKGVVDEAENPGYRFTQKGPAPIEEFIVTPNMLQATQSGQTRMAQEESKRQLSVPIKLRGQVIGIMHLQSVNKRSWEKDIVDITQAIADRVALAVENARLLESSQTQAARERTIGEITSKIGASVNLRNVLQTAVEELGRILPGSDVVIQLKNDKNQE